MTADETACIGDVGEHALIARLTARLDPAPDWVLVGPGDDAAVLAPGRSQVTVVTTDSLIEGVHFRREWTADDAIGHKALAVNLSDLAAMGCRPRAALLSLALPVDLPLSAFDNLLEGFLRLAREHRVPLVGGNISRSPGPLMLDVTAIGEATGRKVLRRAGGRAGDELYVTGRLGRAAAGLALREAGRAPGTDAERECIEALERPRPRVRCGWSVAKQGAASAGIDLSDGLADGAKQLAEASGLGVVVDAGTIPVHAGAAEGTPDGGLARALAGGEDYELLFAVRPRFRRRFLGAVRRFRDFEVTRIGRLTAEPGAWLESGTGREPLGTGFGHFTLAP